MRTSVIKQDLTTGAPIVARSSPLMYIGWLVQFAFLLQLGFIVVYVGVANASERWSQLLVSLTAGFVSIMCLNLTALLIRRATAHISGFEIRELFEAETKGAWSDVRRIEQGSNGLWCVYRLVWKDQTVIFGSLSWTNIRAMIDYASAHSKQRVIWVGRLSSKLPAVELLPFIALALAVSVLNPTSQIREISWAITHIMWSLFLFRQPKQSLPKMHFYLAAFSIVTLVTLALLAGSDLPDTLIWWLYAPLPEIILVPALFWLVGAWKRAHDEQLR